jgi:hypothetical protein
MGVSVENYIKVYISRSSIVLHVIPNKVLFLSARKEIQIIFTLNFFYCRKHHNFVLRERWS